MLSTLVACVLLGGCASIQVERDYDPTADFSHFRSWSWLSHAKREGGDDRVYNDIVDTRVRLAVERTLAAKGYTHVAAGQGEFGVGYHGAVEDKVNVQTVNDYYGYGPGWGYGVGSYGGVGVGVGVPVSRTYVREYEQGTLVLDVVDLRTQKLVWRGAAQAELSQAASQEKRDDLLDQAVDKMFAEFPPS